MELKLGIGIGEIVFGLLESDITGMLGEPDKITAEEESETEVIYQYFDRKLSLTFYEEEVGKLGYIRTSDPEATYNGHKLVGQPIMDVLKTVFAALGDWDLEDYGSLEVYNFEDYWLVLNVEYGCITDIELGVLFNEDDSYNWPKMLMP
jgi:hypothetical protein